MATGLTKKEEIFVNEYVATGNGVQSALKAFDTKDYNSAGVIAHDYLSKAKIQNAIQEALPDEVLGHKHRELLESVTLDHMTFPLESSNDPLTDDEIREYLKEVNCKVRRIVHGEQARHVYFWANDNRAVKDALDMAYKLKGKYAPDKHVNVNIEAEPNDKLDELTKKLNG